MDFILNAKIYNFLQLENPTEDEIKEGALLLLKVSPNRSRGIYNSAMRRPTYMLKWVRSELKKYYEIRQRGLTSADVEKFNAETVKSVEESLSVAPCTVEQDSEETPAVPIVDVRGLREDHDELPDEIKAIWEKNAERWKRMRAMHAQLSSMIQQDGYAPCDGNELCYQLRKVDSEIRADYELYDSFKKPEETPTVKKSKGETVSDNVRLIQKSRTAISRGLSKDKHTEKSLQSIQKAVDVLYSLEQELKNDTVKKLKELGIIIPEKDAET